MQHPRPPYTPAMAPARHFHQQPSLTLRTLKGIFIGVCGGGQEEKGEPCGARPRARCCGRRPRAQEKVDLNFSFILLKASENQFLRGRGEGKGSLGPAHRLPGCSSATPT